MAQQTAVDWLIKRLRKLGYMNSPKYGDSPTVTNVIKEAKAMEKDQIMNAYIDGKTLDFSQGDNARQYYNETYGK